MTPRRVWAVLFPWLAARRYLQCLGVVLPYALAIAVHGPEIELGFGVALVGGEAIQSERGRIVLSLVRGCTILKRACRHCSKAQHKNEGDEARLDFVYHHGSRLPASQI
jgi:hypothetical protein